MRVPVVNTCCCGCSLETGSIIIGWLQLVGAVITTLGALISVFSGGAVTTPMFGILGGILGIALGVLLLTGIKARLARRVHIFVVAITIYICIAFVTMIIIAIVALANAQIGSGIGTLFSGIIFILIEVYCVIVVFNFKRELTPDNQNI